MFSLHDDMYIEWYKRKVNEVLPIHTLDLAPLPCRRVAKIAGAKQRVERLGQAGEIGVHPRRNVARGQWVKGAQHPIGRAASSRMYMT